VGPAGDDDRHAVSAAEPGHVVDQGQRLRRCLVDVVDQQHRPRPLGGRDQQLAGGHQPALAGRGELRREHLLELDPGGLRDGTEQLGPPLRHLVQRLGDTGERVGVHDGRGRQTHGHRAVAGGVGEAAQQLGPRRPGAALHPQRRAPPGREVVQRPQHAVGRRPVVAARAWARTGGGAAPDRGAGGVDHLGDVGDVGDVGDEPVAAAVDRLDDPLVSSGVADRPADGLDAARQRRLRDEPIAPDLVQQLGLGHDPVPVAHQVREDVEHLGLDGDDLSPSPQLQAPDAQLAVTEPHRHWTSSLHTGCEKSRASRQRRRGARGGAPAR
jgi:hypothetical protein